MVGPVAHGGHCVARLPAPDLRVVFVRHALPGEEVVVEITEGTDGDRFWRGDAVSVETASPDRVDAPCPYAGPGRCGGCDFQHVSLSAQRELKAAVVREQLSRLAGLETPVEVEPVPGDEDGLRWRTRMRYVDLPGGRRGLRQHRSYDVVEIDDCLIDRSGAELPGSSAIGPAGLERVGIERVGAAEGTRDFAVEPDGFWQPHVGAPALLVETVLDLLAPRAGESALDLYAGVGLFAAYLGSAVGESGRVTAVESDRAACAHARENLRDLPWVDVQVGSVDRVLARLDPGAVDLVVLDPPREGARRAVVDLITARTPRAVVYVACDPAALARDVAIFAEQGYRVAALRAFDVFPMTSHLEVVAQLVKSGSEVR